MQPMLYIFFHFDVNSFYKYLAKKITYLKEISS